MWHFQIHFFSRKYMWPDSSYHNLTCFWSWSGTKYSKSHCHNSDVMMSALSPQIPSLKIVYWNVYSGAVQRKQQSSTLLSFVRGIHWWPVNSPYKGPVMWKMFPFDDVIKWIKDEKHHQDINTLWLSDAIWWHRSGSALAKVMACCLTVLNLYLNKCWLSISEVLWHWHESNFTASGPATILYNVFENYKFKITALSPRGQWVNLCQLPAPYFIQNSKPIISGDQWFFYRNSNSMENSFYCVTLQ